MHTIKKNKSFFSGFFFWLLSLLLYCRPPLKCSRCYRQQPADEERLEAPLIIPTATELEESGVEFKRKQSTNLLDVTFRDGVMKIPFLSIQDDTAPLFRNLMAFEQCCPTSESHFTSYAALLDNLINTPKDVAVLKKYRVIENLLGHDEKVADLFNSLGKDASLDYRRHYLAQVFKDVNQYCKDDRHMWRARLWRDYLGTPWSRISVIAAIIVLILTVVQAIYAILAYHKPPK